MRKSEWTDEQLEEILSQMPRIKDDRDPGEIYHNITIKMNKRKQRTWVMPTVATASAFLLFFILVPNLFDWQGMKESSMDLSDTSSNASEMAVEKKSLSEDEQQQTASEDSGASIKMAEGKQKMGITSIEINDPSTAVYEEDMIDHEVLTYALPDTNVEFIVPVSLIVPREENKTKFDLFKENMGSLTEEQWGLTEYFPLKAALSFDEENKVLTVDVPADHPYSLSSTTEWLLNQVLNYTMSTLDAEKVKFMTEGNEGIDFSHGGHINEMIYEDQPGDEAYYFYFPNQDETRPFIVPFKFTAKQGTIDEAFSYMRNNQGNRLLAPIPNNMQFETEEHPDDNKLTIRFAKDSLLTDDQTTLYTIEAILLTAKEFNYDTVMLENANIEHIGKFDLTQEIKVPAAANKRIITH